MSLSVEAPTVCELVGAQSEAAILALQELANLEATLAIDYQPSAVALRDECQAPIDTGVQPHLMTLAVTADEEGSIRALPKVNAAGNARQEGHKTTAEAVCEDYSLPVRLGHISLYLWGDLKNPDKYHGLYIPFVDPEKIGIKKIGQSLLDATRVLPGIALYGLSLSDVATKPKVIHDGVERAVLKS